MAEKLKPVKVVKGQRVKPVKLKRSAKITLALPDSEIAILTALRAIEIAGILHVRSTIKFLANGYNRRQSPSVSVKRSANIFVRRSNSPRRAYKIAQCVAGFRLSHEGTDLDQTHTRCSCTYTVQSACPPKDTPTTC